MNVPAQGSLTTEMQTNEYQNIETSVDVCNAGGKTSFIMSQACRIAGLVLMANPDHILYIFCGIKLAFHGCHRVF